ncbi:transforming acidic coiled-coil-containing protein 1-like [Tribolium madens]|uniref:transforming acidic coiled-coil-containing protein 1-like n=1 Tax=Tribolium madens TaxID=41895 RepID=UPI001CF74ECD|nr:transforming acidic coiled-coil-containing protein 1-like [Tribolium madens]XP_044256925.1 transforming acidic coiled-coil-containing protein 1-like [Tribolium madens]
MASQENNIISDSGEKLSQQQEISDLKLQLNASQQTIASLELKVRQKEEVIIKTQADSIKQTQALKSDIKKLKEQLKETSKIIENSSTSELQEALKAAEEKAAKALNDLHDRIEKDQKMNQILEEYEKTIASHDTEYKKLNDLHETVKGNLATLEMAFHDVIQKYERAKAVIEGFKANEEVFKDNIERMEKNLKMEAQRYESLKAHASKQIEKANKENIFLKSQFETLELKQNAIIKRLEIKTAALENSLEQKTKECEELAALCDEVTGKKV